VDDTVDEEEGGAREDAGITCGGLEALPRAGRRWVKGCGGGRRRAEGEVSELDGQHGNGESPLSETRSLENSLAFSFLFEVAGVVGLSPSHLSSATGFVRVARCAAGANGDA
jgi:hypothetical protein